MSPVVPASLNIKFTNLRVRNFLACHTRQTVGRAEDVREGEEGGRGQRM